MQSLFVLLNLVLVEKERASENKLHSKKEPRTDPWGKNLLKNKEEKRKKERNVISSSHNNRSDKG